MISLHLLLSLSSGCPSLPLWGGAGKAGRNHLCETKTVFVNSELRLDREKVVRDKGPACWMLHALYQGAGAALQ